MIITGAPVEKLQFEEVDYWNELVEIFDWAHKHVTSTLYLLGCFGRAVPFLRNPQIPVG